MLSGNNSSTLRFNSPSGNAHLFLLVIGEGLGRHCFPIRYLKQSDIVLGTCIFCCISLLDECCTGGGFFLFFIFFTMRDPNGLLRAQKMCIRERS